MAKLVFGMNQPRPRLRLIAFTADLLGDSLDFAVPHLAVELVSAVSLALY